MTNHDFWMSISDIINEGFTSEGLAKLDDYAEQFSTGKILYKRFSPSEQLGCVKGGTIHVIDLTRGSRSWHRSTHCARTTESKSKLKSSMKNMQHTAFLYP